MSAGGGAGATTASGDGADVPPGTAAAGLKTVIWSVPGVTMSDAKMPAVN